MLAIQTKIVHGIVRRESQERSNATCALQQLPQHIFHPLPGINGVQVVKFKFNGYELKEFKRFKGLGPYKSQSQATNAAARH